MIIVRDEQERLAVGVPCLTRGFTKDLFLLIPGYPLASCDSLNTQFQIFQFLEKGFLFLNFLQLKKVEK